MAERHVMSYFPTDVESIAVWRKGAVIAVCRSSKQHHHSPSRDVSP